MFDGSDLHDLSASISLSRQKEKEAQVAEARAKQEAKAAHGEAQRQRDVTSSILDELDPDLTESDRLTDWLSRVQESRQQERPLEEEERDTRLAWRAARRALLQAHWRIAQLIDDMEMPLFPGIPKDARDSRNGHAAVPSAEVDPIQADREREELAEQLIEKGCNGPTYPAKSKKRRAKS